MKTEKGFAAILLLSLLPVILAGGLALFSIFEFLKSDVATLNLCRTRQLEVQDKVGRTLAKLMKLNPQAIKLRRDQKQAERAVTIARRSRIAVAIAAAEAYLLLVKMRRHTLNLKQKALITSANTLLSSAGSTLSRQLQQEWENQNHSLASWLPSKLTPSESKVPTLAVKPDIPGIAPAYKTKMNFEEEQSWQQSWQIEIQTSGWASRFLKFNERFERSCTTSLYADGANWTAKMKKAKSLLRRFL